MSSRHALLIATALALVVWLDSLTRGVGLYLGAASLAVIVLLGRTLQPAIPRGFLRSMAVSGWAAIVRISRPIARRAHTLSWVALLVSWILLSVWAVTA